VSPAKGPEHPVTSVRAKIMVENVRVTVFIGLISAMFVPEKAIPDPKFQIPEKPDPNSRSKIEEFHFFSCEIPPYVLDFILRSASCPHK
jgi:hypothetical protein